MCWGEVQWIFVLTVTGFDNVCLDHKLLIVHRADFIQGLKRKAHQINRMAAQRLFPHPSALYDVDFLLFSFIGTEMICINVYLFSLPTVKAAIISFLLKRTLQSSNEPAENYHSTTAAPLSFMEQ